MRERSSEDLKEEESDNEREGGREQVIERERQPEGRQYRGIMRRKEEDRCQEAEMKLSNRKEATKEQKEKMYIGRGRAGEKMSTM